MTSTPERTFTSLPTGWPDALWLRIAIGTLMFAIVSGYGGYSVFRELRPNEYLALQSVAMTATLLLAPRGRVGALYFPLTWIGFMVWWFASYQWSVFQPGFLAATKFEFGIVISVVLLATLMPVHYFIRSIIHAGYVCIGLILLAIVLRPGSAFSPGDALAGGGLRGSFGHKNFMTATLCVTTAAVFAFEQRRSVKRIVATISVGLILLSNSSTGLATFLLIVAMYWALDQYGWVRRTLGRSFLTVTVGVALLFVGLFSLSLGPLVALNGKDLTFTGRTEIWNGVIDAIRERPVVGYGWGGVYQSFSVEPTTSITRPLGYPVFHSHNAALELLLRLGAVGLALYLLQFYSMLRVGWRALREFNPVGTFIFLFAAVILMFGFSEIMTVFGVYLGLAVAFPAMRLRFDSTAPNGDEATGPPRAVASPMTHEFAPDGYETLPRRGS